MNKISIFTIVLVMSCAAFGQTWQIPQGSATIDGNLSEWVDANWVSMDVVVSGNPANLSNAKMAARWDTSNNIYLAVTYEDTDLQLSQGLLTWDGQDDIELYINANNDDVKNYGSGAGWITAQQYFIGVNGTSSTGLSSTVGTGAWSNLGSLNPLPSTTYPNAVVDVATSVTGNSVSYEVCVPAYSNMSTGALQSLSAGITVGLDVIAADKGAGVDGIGGTDDDTYGWKGLNTDVPKFNNAGNFQDWQLVNEVTTIQYTFEETAQGTWQVYVDVTGDNTAGLSAYTIWVDGVDPGTVTFAENVLGTSVAGFSASSLRQGDIAGSFNVGNYQHSDSAIEGIGMSDVYETDGTVIVDLDSHAFLGTLTSADLDLTEENFRVMFAGLLNEAGDGLLNVRDITPTVEVIEYVALLAGDANRDGVVSAGDYATVQANFGNTGTPGILGDANGDGVVSAGDYAAVQANFGNTLPSEGTTTTPEPATVSLLSMGVVAVLRRKR